MEQRMCIESCKKKKIQVNYREKPIRTADFSVETERQKRLEQCIPGSKRREGDKEMGRRKAKITITMSERVIRNHIIDYLLKIPIIQISHGINKHIYFIGKFHI